MRLAKAETTVALVGNPNTGKTTLFNALTGLSHRVGNYPGVTVEHKQGRFELGQRGVRVIDLPGTYSLAARSKDELVAVDALLGHGVADVAPDAIIAILDATNLPRNLYLVSQLLELDRPLILALNMSDLARAQGIEIDHVGLSRALGVPVVPIAADRNEGLEALQDALERIISEPAPRAGSRAELPAPLNAATDEVQRVLEQAGGKLGWTPCRAEALRCLVDVDGEFEARFRALLGEEFQQAVAAARTKLPADRPPASVEAHARYAWIDDLVRRFVARPEQGRASLTRRLDALLTHRLWGSATLLLILAGVFQAIYSWSAPLMTAIEMAFARLGSGVEALLPAGPLRSLLVDGVLGGVGGVVVFLPQILVLVFFITLLEDCGYMARAAFLADRLLVRLGLSGKSVIPLLSSFACAVPGIMATRTIDSRKDRLATILVAPLMSCSARLPVYVLFIGAFVPDKRWMGGWIGLQGLVLFGAHLIGVVVAAGVLLVFKHTLFRGPTAPFLMELPPYRLPHWRNVVSRLVDQGRAFLIRAGSVIFAVAVVIWGLSYFPHPASIHEHYEQARASVTAPEVLAQLDREEAGAYLRASVLGRAGHLIEPVVRQAGWDWRIGIAVTSSFAAREVVIATMGTIFNVGDDATAGEGALREVLARATWPDGRPLFTLPVALSLVIFFALCCQCVATLAVIRRETGSWGWTGLTFSYMTTLAYLAAIVVYRGARWLGMGG